MTELFVENTRIDLSETESIRLNKSINDIRQIDSKNTAFTRTIKVPGTAQNNKAFGFIYELNRNPTYNLNAKNISFNYTASKSAKCLLKGNGFLIVKGILRLMKVTIKNGVITYECTVYGELGGLKAALGEKLLTDLDFSEYTQAWNFANVSSSWALAGAGNGIFFPLINYGLCTINKKDYNFRAFRPAFYLREYLLKSLKDAGYTYDCPLFDSSFFKKLIIPHNEDDLYKIVDQLLGRFVTPADISSWSTFGFLNSGTSISPRLVPYKGGSVMNNFTPSPAYDSFHYTGSSAALISINTRITGDWVQFSNIPLTLRVIVNTAIIYEYKISGDWQKNGTLQYFAFNVNNLQFTINPGDSLQFQMFFSTLAVPTPAGQTVAQVFIKFGQLNVKAVGSQPAPLQYNDTINIGNCIPKNIKQVDLWNSVINAFNLQIDEDPLIEKKLVIRPYVQYYSGRENWTDKIDRGEEMTITPMGELTSKQFSFQFEKDSDYYNDLYFKTFGKGYGDRLSPTGYEFGTDEKPIKILFANTPIIGDANTDKKVSTILKFDSSSGEARIGSKPRLMMCKNITSGIGNYDVHDWVPGFQKIETNTSSTTVTGIDTTFTTQVATNDFIIVNGAIIGQVSSVNNNSSITLIANAKKSVSSSEFFIGKYVGTASSFPYAGHLDDPKTPTIDLSWKEPDYIYYAGLTGPYTTNNFYNAYWDHFINEIVNPNAYLLTCFVHLTSSELANLSFAKYKNIDGSLFRLNKVIDYDTDSKESTKIELIKIINPKT